MNSYMQEALNEAYEGINSNHGGPFGSVVVKEGKIIGRGHNKVLFNNDPTCHGEIEAIRDACRNTENHDLSGCVLYTTAEPCPMCRGAILWANIEKVYYGCTISDTDMIGFRDQLFYDNWEKYDNEFAIQLDHDKCLELFSEYNKMNSIKY